MISLGRPLAPSLGLALALLGTTCVGNCCGNTPGIADVGGRGSLLARESTTLAGMMADGGAAGPGLAAHTVTDWTLGFQSSPLPSECILLIFDQFQLSMECPPGPGTFQVATLAGKVCDDSQTCASLGGTIDVNEFVPPCSDRTCGSINFSLNLPLVGGGDGPFVSGMVTAWITYDSVRAQCGPQGGISD